MSKKKRLEGDLGAFVQQYARKSDPHSDPNDRRYDRKIEDRVKRMDPETLSELLHGTEHEGLEKDPAVFEMLSNLRQSLGSTAFVIVDHWEADLQAIGVAHPRNHRILAYIAVTESPGRFDVLLESPADAGSELPYVEAGSYFDREFVEVVSIVRGHLQGADDQNPK